MKKTINKKDLTKKEPFYKRPWFLILVALLIIGAIGNIFEDEDNTENIKKPQTTNEKSSNEEVENIKKDENGEKVDKEKDDRPIDETILEDSEEIIEANFYEDGTLSIEIEGDGSLSVNTMVSNRAMSILEAMKIAFEDENVKKVRGNVTATMVDSKGNESIKDVVSITYNRETFEELNYKNFHKMAWVESWRVYNEADEYYIDINIYNDLKDQIKDNLIDGNYKY